MRCTYDQCWCASFLGRWWLWTVALPIFFAFSSYTMSESLNWPAIGLWTALTGFQLGTAIRDILNHWRQRRQSIPPTDYQRVIDGEQINGWKMAIPVSSIERHIGVDPDGPVTHELIYPRWMTNADLTNFSRYSQLLWFKHSSDISRDVFHLNRFSLLSPNAHAWMMRVTYNGSDWDVESAYYITDRLVVIVFQSDDQPIFRLILLDVVTGSHRIVVIKSPMQGDSPALLMVFRSNLHGRMNVVFGDMSRRNAEMTQMDYEITIASYVIADSGTVKAPIKATSWQSISIPIGQKFFLWQCVSPCLQILHIYQSPMDIENIRSYIFSEGTWRVESLSSWWSSFRETSYGAKWINAVESFRRLSSPSLAHGQLSPLRYTEQVSGFMVDGAVFCDPDINGFVLQRSLNPHSLKRLSAEAFCKANPKFDFADLKSIIAFDVFDGIFDGKEPLMIHL